MDVFTVDIDENFWEVNPQWKYHSAFKDLYENDSSKGKFKSSRVMWAVMLYADGLRSQFYLLTDREKEEEITANYLQKAGTWDEVMKYVEPYKKFVMSAAERRYQAQQDKLTERTQFLMKTLYDVETVPILDNIQKTTPLLEKVLKELESELTGGQGAGTWRGKERKTPVEEKKF